MKRGSCNWRDGYPLPHEVLRGRGELSSCIDSGRRAVDQRCHRLVLSDWRVRKPAPLSQKSLKIMPHLDAKYRSARYRRAIGLECTTGGVVSLTYDAKATRVIHTSSKSGDGGCEMEKRPGAPEC